MSFFQEKNTTSGEAADSSVIHDANLSPLVVGEPKVAIAVIGENTFERELLSSSLGHVLHNATFHGFGSVQEWERKGASDPIFTTVLYSTGDRCMCDETTRADLRALVGHSHARRVIVISRDNDPMAIFDAIDCGATSFISADAGLGELLEAIRVSSEKTVVVPRSCLLALRGSVTAPAARAEGGLERYFTERQLAVAKALQRGAANKTIAYELGLCESTVKVHIRNIMRKLRATNRTQAAYRLNELANGSTEIEVRPDVS